MPDRDCHLEKTTQTDLLYGLSQADVAVLEQVEERVLDSFGACDRLLEQAATRDDLSLAGSTTATIGGRPGMRWKYPEGFLPPERKKPFAATLPQVIDAAAPAPRTLGFAARQLVRGSCGWLISLVLHVLLLPALAMLTLPALTHKPVLVYRGATAAPPVEMDVVEVAVAPAIPTHFHQHTSQPLKVELALPEPRFERGAMPGLLAEASFVSTLGKRPSGPVADVLGMMASEGRGKTQSGTGQGGAEFFGTKASGSKFVFVVDCSLSMLENGRWIEATRELNAAIDRLSSEQLFYVILFDGHVHRMFNHDERQAALFPATPENKERFRMWLSTVRLGHDTFPFLAMKSAIELRPDAVYLLSDGDFRDATADYLKKFNRPYDSMGQKQHQAAVHTFSFHSRVGQAVMRRIARENAGQYLFVPAR